MQTYRIEARGIPAPVWAVFRERMTQDDCIDFLRNMERHYGAEVSLSAMTAQTANFHYKINPEQ